MRAWTPPPPQQGLYRFTIEYLNDTTNAPIPLISCWSSLFHNKLVITVVLCSPPPVGYLVTLNGFVAPPDVVTVISRYRSRTLTISRITPRVALFIVQFHNSLSPDQVALLRPPLEPGPRLTAPDGSWLETLPNATPIAERRIQWFYG